MKEIVIIVIKGFSGCCPAKILLSEDFEGGE
jgi:hypothetical protein